MATTINADTSTGGAIVTGDASGVLELQSAGSTKLTVNGSGVALSAPLPVASGGTGATSLSGLTTGTATNIAGGSNGTIPYQSAAGTTQMLAVGTAGQVLQTNGAGAPTWVTVSSGLSEWDQWRLTTNSTSNGVLTANLERNDNNFAVGGTGMTQSSGIFTFPSTGKWLVRFFHNGAGLERSYIELSTDSGSTYANVAQVEFVNGDGVKKGGSMESIINVSSTSTFRVRFFAGTSGAGATTYGNTNINYTYMTFIKLAS